MITQKDSSGLSLKHKNHSFLARVVFGMPSKRCLFHGICQLDIVTDFGELLPIRQAYAILIKNKDNTLNICFIIDSMDNTTREKHFYKQQFHIMEDKIFHTSTKKTLGIKTILKGIYPFTVTEEFFKITVPIQAEILRPKEVSKFIYNNKKH